MTKYFFKWSSKIWKTDDEDIQVLDDAGLEAMGEKQLRRRSFIRNPLILLSASVAMVSTLIAGCAAGIALSSISPFLAIGAAGLGVVGASAITGVVSSALTDIETNINAAYSKVSELRAKWIAAPADAAAIRNESLHKKLTEVFDVGLSEPAQVQVPKIRAHTPVKET